MLSLILSASLAGQCPAAGAPAPVRIETERAGLLHVRNFRGSYERHFEELARLRADFRSEGSDQPLVVGFYPEDPDAVGMSNVRWQLAVKLDEQRSGEGADGFFNRIDAAHPTRRSADAQIMQPGPSAALNSTIRKSRSDGLAMLRWLACSKYAQAGPTRMEYLDASGGLDARVRIVVPVVPRVWEGPR